MGLRRFDEVFTKDDRQRMVNQGTMLLMCPIMLQHVLMSETDTSFRPDGQQEKPNTVAGVVEGAIISFAMGYAINHTATPIQLFVPLAITAAARLYFGIKDYIQLRRNIKNLYELRIPTLDILKPIADSPSYTEVQNCVPQHFSD